MEKGEKEKIVRTSVWSAGAGCHGWWLPETEGREPNLFSTWEHNINNLVPMGTQSRSGYGGATYRNGLCRVTKIKE